MSKKSLILYASLTGNTNKVAVRFQEVFQKMGWECDMEIISRTKARDIEKPSIDFQSYDFLCLGSYIHKAMPNEVILDARALDAYNTYGVMIPPSKDGVEEGPSDEQLIAMNKEDFDPHARQREGGKSTRMVFGPDSKKGIVFVTYAGEHEGPREALPALALLEHEMGHLHFQCVDRFACPGRFAGAHGWFKDLPTRPHERDLMKAQIFLEEILEEIEWAAEAT